MNARSGIRQGVFEPVMVALEEGENFITARELYIINTQAGSKMAFNCYIILPPICMEISLQ
jgi:hypothetical protein